MFGIYIHIPFCRTACHYCDFHFSTNLRTLEAMEAALVKEIHIKMAALQPQMHELQSVYFGGGTPSLFPVSGLRRLLNMMLPGAVNVREITLEANPEDITRERLAQWREMGITRLSIGIQTFDQERLDWMNRKHTVATAEESVHWAADAGFEHVSADLIYGLPNRREPFESELARFTALPVDHLSAYILTVEPQTALGRQVSSGKERVVEDAQIEAEYAALCAAMDAAQFEHYEVSNWAKPGGHAVHNQHYWSGMPYWGIGPGAHGFDGKRRFANVANNPRYIQGVERATTMPQLPFETEVLTDSDRYNEAIMTGLRTANGIDLNALERAFSLRPDTANPREWNRAMSAGWVVDLGGERYRIPEPHWLLADAISADLFWA